MILAVFGVLALLAIVAMVELFLDRNDPMNYPGHSSHWARTSEDDEYDEETERLQEEYAKDHPEEEVLE